MTGRQARQRAEREAQRVQAQRILDGMDAPAPPVTARAAEAATRFSKWAGGQDEAESHYSQRGYLADDLSQVEDDPETGCQLWTGRYSTGNMGIEYPAYSATHRYCGRAHWQVARALFEEALGRRLDDSEWIISTCETNTGNPTRRPCVSPLHHRVRE
jgi:hypothetical protein